MKRSGKGKRAIFPFFLTHAGCGSKCSFCDQETLTGVSSGLMSAFHDFRERILSYRIQPGEIALYGGDILNLPPTEMVRLLDDVTRFLSDELGTYPMLRVSSSPRSISREKLSLLDSYNVKVIEIGVVSTSKKVLFASRRGYDPRRAMYAVQLAKDMGFEVGVQFITGLPGDTFEDFDTSLSEVLSLGPHFAILYPLVVLAGTELGRNYRLGLFNPPGRSYIVRTAVLFLLSLNVWNVQIGRIGLHETDMDRAAVLHHPFPGNLRQEAEGELYRIMVEYLMWKSPGTVTVQISEEMETSVRGKKSENLRKILTAHPHLSGRILFNRKDAGVVGKSGCGRHYEVMGGEMDFFSYVRGTLRGQERA